MLYGNWNAFGISSTCQSCRGGACPGGPVSGLHRMTQLSIQVCLYQKKQSVRRAQHSGQLPIVRFLNTVRANAGFVARMPSTRTCYQ